MNTLVKNKIEDIDEFSKLNKINVPVSKYFDYYISTLKKSREFVHLDALIDDFSDLEKYSKALGYSSAKSYKLDYALPKILKYIENTKVYDVIQNYNFPDTSKLYTKDEVKKSAGQNYWLISFDIRKANFSSFKILDEGNEMKDSWEELCEFLDIHPTLAKSKSFRQVVFGNTNPKRLQRLQHLQVHSAIQYLKLKGLSEDNICFVSHDEFVLRFKQDDKNDIWQTNHYSSDQMLSELSAQMMNVPLRSTVYELDKLAKDIFLKQMFVRLEGGGIEPTYKTLFGAPGNKFYKYFKLYILKEELDDRDLYFVNDGEIAKWATKEDSIEESFAPEGEMTLAYVKMYHKNFFKKLTDELPTLTDAQKRKIIWISTGLCKSCMDEDSGCNCGRDE